MGLIEVFARAELLSYRLPSLQELIQLLFHLGPL